MGFLGLSTELKRAKFEPLLCRSATRSYAFLCRDLSATWKLIKIKTSWRFWVKWISLFRTCVFERDLLKAICREEQRVGHWIGAVSLSRLADRFEKTPPTHAADLELRDENRASQPVIGCIGTDLANRHSCFCICSSSTK